MDINENINLCEDYVSFETAKLLKEKGFNGECLAIYEPNGILETFDSAFNYNIPGGTSGVISAPTLQMAMKWLRKEHRLHCSVDYDYVLRWYCQITDLKETIEYDYEEMKHYHPEKDNCFSSPEEAYEAAIKYCLKFLI